MIPRLLDFNGFGYEEDGRGVTGVRGCNSCETAFYLCAQVVGSRDSSYAGWHGSGSYVRGAQSEMKGTVTHRS